MHHHKPSRFLNNKYVSSLGALSFLAIWHGLHIGYFTCFFLEFLDVEAEREWKDMIAPISRWIYSDVGKSSNLIKRVLRMLYRVGGYLWCTFVLHYALVSFDQLTWGPSRTIWSHLSWTGHVLVLIIFVGVVITA